MSVTVPDKTTQQMLTGTTPFFAAAADPRFSFCLHVPPAHVFDRPPLPLLVVVHGTRRSTAPYTRRLAAFAAAHRLVVLCPLFPAGIIEPLDVHNYKALRFHDIRFDLLLLSILDQAARTWRVHTHRFFLHGFSGGAQFAHRFAYLHPARLAGLSVAAPGSVTLPDPARPWPAGIADLRTLFDAPEPDFAALARVPVQLLVGARDTDTALLARDDRAAMRTRVDRTRALHAALAAAGVAAELAILPGVAHDGPACLPALEAWLAPLADAFAFDA
ncbi:Alpha/Beta hydrolase protein [Mycena sp. CBHHK59/15]|nr:Alpha/Beta hydrolase protein [Mycena sp. CBHHK59/15]